MSWKIIISFTLILQFTSTFTQNANSLTKRQREVQNSTIEEIVNHNRVYWNRTMPDKNLQLIPLALFTSRNVMEIRSHYEGASALYFPKDRLLEIGYSFANIIDTLQESPNVKLKFKNAIFYDDKSTNKQYLNDVKTRFHGEAYEVSFTSNNTESILALFNKWMSSITKKPQPKLESPLMAGMNSFHTTVFTFEGCWDKPKISDDDGKKTLKFKTPVKEVEINVLQAEEKLGYYNNPELKYEAIRLPYKNEEFAMIIVLPYLNHSLDLFRTLKDPDYLQILERVNKNTENIEYSIPLMNSAMITLNVNGTSVNKDDSIVCDWSSSSILSADRQTSYKSFVVDRPFGVIIYQEKTKFVLSHLLVRNPTLGVSAFRQYSGKFAPIENNKPKYPLIPSYVVYY